MLPDSRFRFSSNIFCYICAALTKLTLTNIRYRETHHRFPTQTFHGAEKLRPPEIHRRPDGRHHRRHRRPPPRHRIRHSQRRFARKGTHHRHHRRLHRLVPRRQQRPDRRPHGSLHRHRRRHHQPVRHRRTRHRHRHGRHHPCPARTLQTRRRHQIHPLSHHRGLHGWYCSDDILHPDKRPLRSTYRRSTSTPPTSGPSASAW